LRGVDFAGKFHVCGDFYPRCALAWFCRVTSCFALRASCFAKASQDRSQDGAASPARVMRWAALDALFPCWGGKKDQAMKSLLILFAAAALASAAPAQHANAKPKSTSLGCTMKQIIDAAHDTPAGRECSRQQDESVINNTTFIAFVCTSSGVYCCPVNASSSADCTKISSLRTPKAGTLNKALGSGIFKK
jgi:hypothetical protein